MVVALTAGTNAASQMRRAARDGYGSDWDFSAVLNDVRFTPDCVAKFFLHLLSLISPARGHADPIIMLGTRPTCGELTGSFGSALGACKKTPILRVARAGQS